MTYKKTIDKLWQEFQRAIESTYVHHGNDDIAACLRDYTESSWNNDLGKLVDRETANERQHRHIAPTGYKAPISASDAARLLLMNNAAEGSTKQQMPPATIFLQFRQTAAEGIVLGFLVREHITNDWREQVKALDYAKIMNGGR